MNQYSIFAILNSNLFIISYDDLYVLILKTKMFNVPNTYCSYASWDSLEGVLKIINNIEHYTPTFPITGALLQVSEIINNEH